MSFSVQNAEQNGEQGRSSEEKFINNCWFQIPRNMVDFNTTETQYTLSQKPVNLLLTLK